MAETLRLFFALPLPEQLRTAASEVQQQCAVRDIKISWTRPQNMHFTLKFLGEMAAQSVPQLVGVARQVAQSSAAHPLTVATAGAFPNSRRPRVIWLGCTTGAEQLSRLGTELAGALAEAKLAPPETRDFVPHLTLGRVRKGHDFTRLTAALDRVADCVLGEMWVDHFVLMRSELQGGEPPIYTELARFDLGCGQQS